MIAPLRPPQTRPASGNRRLLKAHEFVATALLGQKQPSADGGPPLSARTAWAFALWSAAVTAAYAASMLGLW